MSEYQFVHFLALDRPLDAQQLEFMERQGFAIFQQAAVEPTRRLFQPREVGKQFNRVSSQECS